MSEDQKFHQAVMTYRLQLLAELQKARCGDTYTLADLHDRVVLLNLLDRESAMLLSTAEPVAK